MAEEETHRNDGVLQRSATGLLIATGVAAGGLGKLADGVANVKKAFGDKQPPANGDSQPQQPQNEPR
jgi:hypothetical protein